MEEKIKKLQEPLSTSDIEFRVQSINKGGYATILAYKNARVDMQRLNDVVGALNWKREHTRDNANCIVSIWDDSKNQWISKEDTGTESFTEAKKGLASDSFKRANFNWGIGVELYSYPVIQVKLNSDEFEIKDGKAKQTWNLKLREWEWQVQFDKKTVTKIVAKDQNGKERYLFGKDTLTIDHENYDKVKSFLSGGGDIKEVEKKYILSDEIKKELE